MRRNEFAGRGAVIVGADVGLGPAIVQAFTEADMQIATDGAATLTASARFRARGRSRLRSARSLTPLYAGFRHLTCSSLRLGQSRSESSWR